MPRGVAADVTELLRRVRRGDPGAAGALFSTTYADLQRLARARLRAAGRGSLLDTTSLVHEWFVRFVRQEGLELADGAHFMRYAARAMRSLIVDHVRRRIAGRRGGGSWRVSLTAAEREAALAGADEILGVHQALEELDRLDPRQAEVVELRYFCGLTEAEIAATLGVNERTVRRDWEKARLWLARAMGS